MEDGLEEDVDEAQAQAEAQAAKPTNPTQSVMLGISAEGMAKQDALALQAKLQAGLDQQGIKATVMMMMQEAPAFDAESKPEPEEAVGPTEEHRIEKTIRVLGELEDGEVIGACCKRCNKILWYGRMYAVRRDAAGKLASTLSIKNDLLEHQVQTMDEATEIMSAYAHCAECCQAVREAEMPSE